MESTGPQVMFVVLIADFFIASILLTAVLLIAKMRLKMREEGGRQS